MSYALWVFLQQFADEIFGFRRDLGERFSIKRPPAFTDSHQSVTWRRLTVERRQTTQSAQHVCGSFTKTRYINSLLLLTRRNPLECRGNYNATSNNIKLVHWPLMGGLLHLVQREGDWAGPQHAHAPPCCTKCNSPPINGQCTNHRIAV